MTGRFVFACWKKILADLVNFPLFGHTVLSTSHYTLSTGTEYGVRRRVVVKIMLQKVPVLLLFILTVFLPLPFPWY